MLTPEQIADGWKPVRKGPIYCAPKCGCGCTYADYEAAVSSADELCAIMGDGWKPRVWENGGWHYSAQKGCTEIYPRKASDAGCTIYFNSQVGQIVVSGEGYNQTLHELVATVKEKIRLWQSDLDIIAYREEPSDADA